MAASARKKATPTAVSEARCATELLSASGFCPIIPNTLPNGSKDTGPFDIPYGINLRMGIGAQLQKTLISRLHILNRPKGLRIFSLGLLFLFTGG